MTCLINKLLLIIFTLQLIILLGCGSKLKRNPAPIHKMSEAVTLDEVAIRAPAGTFSPEFQEDIIQSVKTFNEVHVPTKPGCAIQDPLLALSGGGGDGAFGSGFLNGWSDSGTRPIFKLVTGVSSGALIAPFAFLGSEYDHVLRKIYTGITTEDIAKSRGIAAVWSESLATVDPLIELISAHVDEKLLKEIAKRHAEGQRLIIGTTNLDTGQFFIWNMGVIASSSDPGALDLFRKVLLASSSMPLFFPPVLIDVQVEGNKYDEMHVDGGVMSQVFFYGFILDIAELDNTLNLNKENKCVEIYVIRNGKLAPDPVQVERNIVDIAKRTITMMTSASAFNDMVRIYYFTTQDNFGFNYTSVPDNFNKDGDEPFDQEVMRRLYDLGYQMGRSGDAWNTELPWGK